ncbi:SubName: Full=Uncharacterized protein {ECO:0000313/EMBL:CCA67740.1} [Serendipita indica DSM 11827]|uniref:Uncharacterized protein n=1 Tax=Serendipita indica (strain DSM 11827) TaxID=1109443 RepID=G4T8U6_SERID|nr:SubName: Full=Uncharacterized protein {ECO:0000313/EMBL:CCA67740.1} [Serendipita indica DSM 11827]CCA67740.1 hypothetical protein PIIN_01567 [Serendipita indica DSM 11827]
MPPIPKSVAVVSAGILIGAIALPVAVLIVGFSTGGVVAGSMAAGIQSGIGNVAAGSTFAAMQSIGTTPLTSVLYGGIIGGAVVGGGVGAAKLTKHPEVIRDIGRHIAAGARVVGEHIKDFLGFVPSKARAVGEYIKPIVKSILGKLHGDTVGVVGFAALAQHISHSSTTLAVSAREAFVDMGKAIGGLALPETAKGVKSAFEALNVTSTAHYAIENVEGVVGDAKSAIGSAVGKFASNIFN